MKTLTQMKNSPQDNFPKMIIVHHTGGTNANPLADTSHHTFETVQNYHISLGWENIGYHWFIDKTGKVTEGRPEHYHGSHCNTPKPLGHNKDSIGICLAGNFDATLPTKEQENALKSLIGAIRGRWSDIGDNIYPHRKFSSKTCYGKKLSDTWALDLVNIISGETTEMVSVPKKLIQDLSKYI